MRCEYSVYKITDDIIFITDEDGPLSITNGAEEVVKEVLKHYPNKRIIYYDTDGYWSELVHNNTIFIRFGTRMSRYIKDFIN